MSDYPILFRIRHVVRGQTFEAIVTAAGRTVIGREEAEWWCHGVEPGGLTENGEDPSVAFHRFCAAFRRGLDDIAEAAMSLEAFRAEANMLFATDDHDEARWFTALKRIQGKTDLEDPFNQLDRVAWTKSTLEIQPIASLVGAPLSDEAFNLTALPKAA